MSGTGHSWAARRWHDLDRLPNGNAVAGTVSAALLAVLACLVRVLVNRDYVEWRGDGALAALVSAVGGVAGLVAATAGLYHLCARLDLGRAGRLLGVAVLLVNPDLLGAMDRPRTAFLLAGLFTALAGLARWVRATRTPSGGELATYVGAPATLAVFAGYEGWLLVVLVLAVVAAVQLDRGRGARSALTRAVSVAGVPAVAGAWWVTRGVVRGQDLSAVLPVPGLVLSSSAAIGLGCLLVAVPVLAGITGLMRAQLQVPSSAARAVRVDVPVPRQRRTRVEV